MTALNVRFFNLSEKIIAVENQTIGLRQAINPIKPDEILRIARLKDEVVSLKKNMADLENSITKQQKVFQDSVLREIKSSSDSTTLILVVLLPLVLNFLYTVWKDLRVASKEDE